MLHVDQIVIGIGEDGWFFESAGPLGRRIGWRDELRLNLGRRTERRVVQRCEILLHRPAAGLGIDLLLPLDAGDGTLTVGVGFDQARVNGEAFAADQPGPDAGPDDALEDAPEEIALGEVCMAGAGERRVVRNRVLQAQLAEPS
jgi:hypothetical protein